MIQSTSNVDKSLTAQVKEVEPSPTEKLSNLHHDCLIKIPKEKRTELLGEIIKAYPDKKIIVFTTSSRTATVLSDNLYRLFKNELGVITLPGNASEDALAEILSDYNHAGSRVLISSIPKIANLGLKAALIVNFELPVKDSDYRSQSECLASDGDTGAFSFLTDSEIDKERLHTLITANLTFETISLSQACTLLRPNPLVESILPTSEVRDLVLKKKPDWEGVPLELSRKLASFSGELLNHLCSSLVDIEESFSLPHKSLGLHIRNGYAGAYVGIGRHTHLPALQLYGQSLINLAHLTFLSRLNFKNERDFNSAVTNLTSLDSLSYTLKRHRISKGLGLENIMGHDFGDAASRLFPPVLGLVASKLGFRNGIQIVTQMFAPIYERHEKKVGMLQSEAEQVSDKVLRRAENVAMYRFINQELLACNFGMVENGSGQLSPAHPQFYPLGYQALCYLAAFRILSDSEYSRSNNLREELKFPGRMAKKVLESFISSHKGAAIKSFFEDELEYEDYPIAISTEQRICAFLGSVFMDGNKERFQEYIGSMTQAFAE